MSDDTTYSEYVPEGFGTGDLVIVADGVIEVIDFKGGRGVRVDATRNSQLMLYGLGALLEFDPLYDIRTVRMTIVQPRLSNTSTYEITAGELIRWAESEVRPKAAISTNNDFAIRRKEFHMSIRVKTGKVRASFVHVFEPAAINGGEPNIIIRNAENLKALLYSHSVK